MKALLDQKQKMINEVIEWENNLIRQIRENVNKQKDLLEKQCKNQSDYLQIKRQEYLDTALIYEERRDREQVRQLLEQCHTLTCELGSFEYPEQPIPFIRIQKDKQPVEVKQDSTNTRKFENKSTINDNFRIEDNKNTHTSRSTSASTNQINQQLLTTSFSINDGHYNLNSNVINNNDMVERCPACFMVFPSTMGTNERSKHVNQHFGDN